jgi:uncharacterized protein (TIGR02266 family)
MSSAISRTVFVVDDSATMRQLAGAWLERLGFRPICLDSGERCLEELQTKHPALILLDLGMRGMSGADCCDRIKLNPAWRDIPVVMMTAADSPRDVMGCYRAHADDFLPKPLSLEHLELKLDALLGTSEPSPHGRVLFVGKSQFFSRVVGAALEQSGFHLKYASSAEEALELVKRDGETLDVVLADLTISGKSGLALASALQAMPHMKGKPVGLFSGIEDRPDVHSEVLRVTGNRLYDRRDGDIEAIVRHVFTLLGRSPTEMRASERAPFFSVVELAASTRTYSGFSYEVSEGGLFMRTMSVLPPGTRVKVSITLSALKDPTVSTGVVAWSNRLGPHAGFSYPAGMGIRWVKMAEALQAHLAPLLRKAHPPAAATPITSTKTVKPRSGSNPSVPMLELARVS